MMSEETKDILRAIRDRVKPPEQRAMDAAARDALIRAEQADFDATWPHQTKLPKTRYEEGAPGVIQRIRDRGNDPVRKESTVWCVEQGFKHSTRNDVIGFQDPDHAFAFKMRWG